MRSWLVLVLLAATACTAPAAGRIRFLAQPPIWRVDDTRPLAKKPAERIYNRTLYQIDGFLVRRLTRAMDVPPKGRALDVNSIDEVPDSSWFTNRIGVRDVSLDELRRGPNKDDSPFAHLPWTITGGKVGGLSLGFVIEDAKKTKYLLKFDVRQRPEMETAAHIIGHRLLWAAGYNVPQDHVGYITRDQLLLSPKATAKDALGNKTPLGKDVVDKGLETVFKTTDGRYRVLVSKFIEGTPIGPVAREGTRPDDANDRIPHERRRTIRGQIPLFSWINHTDIQEDNSLDSYVTEEGSKDRGHVVHYLIDFGKAFGVINNSNNWKTAGYAYRLDVGRGLLTLLSLGLWNRPWDQIDSPGLVGIGVFEANHFEPAIWRTNSPYWPFDDADQYDGFWGAKIAMRFTRAHIEAAVDEAKLSDPRAARYMVDTLVARQRKVAQHWFAQVSPLDHFTVTPANTGTVTLCFDDLALMYGIERVPGRYEISVLDRDSRTLADARQSGAGVSSSAGHACTELPVSPAADHYTIVRIAAKRGGATRPAVRVHLAQTARGMIEVIGLRRD